MVSAVTVDFKWFPGFAKSQTQKNIMSLHEAAEEIGISPVLEVSRRSLSPLGSSLSAFDLLLRAPDGQEISVECAFQGSKVFEKGGPYHDLYSVSSRNAKTDDRLRNSGDVIAFNYFGRDYPIEPQTAFYDWLYVTALCRKQSKLTDALKKYQGFSDIFFNPRLSINCQARAVAGYVAWKNIDGTDDSKLCDWTRFSSIFYGEEKPTQELISPEDSDLLEDSRCSCP